MIIIEDFVQLPDNVKNSTLIIGNFDSVHKGHQYLIKEAKNIATQTNTKLALLSFSPHPHKFFVPDSDNINILTTDVKADLLQKNGIEIFFIKKFDESFSQTTPENFIEHFLVKTLSIKNLIVGKNFRFGAKKAGDIELLAKNSEKYGFGFFPAELLNSSEGKISSSLIREYLAKGEIAFASNLLGYDYFIEGKVIEGDKRGAKIGFPTANLNINHIMPPKLGVYAAKVQIEGDDEIYKSVVNIGPRPTIDTKKLIEAHIFDFDKDIYGKKIKIYLKKYIRSQVKFNNLSELKIQIKLDVQKTKELLKR